MPDRLTFKQLIRDYAVVLLAPVALFLPMILRGEVLFWGTPALQFVPWWIAAWHSLQQGVLPLWNPLNGMGAPLIANYQVAFFYPPDWLLLVLAAIGGAEKAAGAIAWGFSVLTILHLAWGGLGTALLLRRLKFPWLAQVLGGIAWGLSGYVVGRIGFFSMAWAASWLPWVVYFTDHIASVQDYQVPREPSRFQLQTGLLISFTMQLLSGHAQLTWYTILIAAVWVPVGAWRSCPQCRWYKELLITWASFGATLALAAGLAMIQLAPTFEYLRFSHRSDAVAYEEAMTYSFWPWRLVSLFSPDFFGNPTQSDYWGYATYWEDHVYAGLLPLLLSLSTLWLVVKGIFQKRHPQRWRLLIFLWILIFIAFVLALGRNTPVFPLLYHYVPTFSMFQAPARYLIWVALAIPLLGAIGIEHWRSPEGRGLYWLRLGTAGAFAITLGAGLTALSSHDVRTTFIKATALTGVWALGFGLLTLAIPYADKYHRKNIWQWVVIGWTLADLLLTAWSLNASVSSDFFIGKSKQPEALQSLEPGGRIYISQEEENDLKFQRFLRFKDYAAVEDWRNLRNALIPNLNLLDGIATTNNFDPLVPDRYARWMQAIEKSAPQVKQDWLAWMGVGVIEHIDASQPAGVRFDPIAGSQRWHWSPCAQAVRDEAQVGSRLGQELLSPPQANREVLIEGDLPEKNTNCSQTNPPSVRMIMDKSDRVQFEVDGQQAGWFELVDSIYPGWTARIDGRPAWLYTADGNFRAVYVGPGKHLVEYRYIPSGFYFGVLFSILILLLTLFLGIKTGRIAIRKLPFIQSNVTARR